MNNSSKKYFKVLVKCGHVGRRHYVPIQFPIIAESKKEAANIARWMPRVKHNHKDAILNVFEISYEQFLELKLVNHNDPYLRCHSRREQNEICDLTERMVEETHRKKTKIDKEIRRDKIAYIKKKNKIIKRYNKEEEYAYQFDYL